jgi:aldehyde:ferredoxin oxidoreductase
MDEYYELRGWNIRTGIPSKETLQKLDLTDVVLPLEKKVI